MIKLLIAVFVAMLTLSGCASLSGEDDSARLPVMYGTLKLIEQSDSVTQEKVLARVEWVRARIDGEDVVSLPDLRQELFERLDLTGLSPADRFLLHELVGQVETTIELDIGSGVLDEDAKARLGQVLDWIETAARLAG